MRLSAAVLSPSCPRTTTTTTATTLLKRKSFQLPPLSSKGPGSLCFRLSFPQRDLRDFRLSALSKPPTESSSKLDPQDPGADGDDPGVLHQEELGGLDLGWLPAFPHVLAASMANFLFGYHIGVMNGPIEAIARELGFEGNPFLEGLVVSIFIVGAFIGSISSSSLVDKLGYRRTLQIDTIPLIVGALLSAQAHSLDEILWGRFLVGLGIGVNTALVPIYISEENPLQVVEGLMMAHSQRSTTPCLNEGSSLAGCRCDRQLFHLQEQSKEKSLCHPTQHLSSF